MNFEKLALEHYGLLKPYLKRHPYRLSLFSPASVFTWREEAGTNVYFSIDNDTLFMACINHDSPEKNYLALPLPPDPFSPDRLAQLARRTGFESFDIVPETYIEGWGESRVRTYFEVHEQTVYKDYVYKTENLTILPGQGFAKKRNLIKQFERDFVDPGRVEVIGISQTVVGECKGFVEKWYENRENGLDARAAAIRAIDEFEELELCGIAVRVDGEIAGIGTCAPLCREMGILNLEMAASEMKGLYQFLDRECAVRLFSGRFKYINKESDMGLPGLAQSKRSYNPDFRVGCFKLSLKNN